MKKTCALTFEPHNSKVSKLTDEADNCAWGNGPELLLEPQGTYVSVCDESGVDVSFPAVWSDQECLELREKYKWLSASNGNLGCSDCATVSSLGLNKTEGSTTLSTEWANFKVIFNGSNKIKQLRSLRSKIALHQSSITHRKAQQISSQVKKSRLDEVLKFTKLNKTYQLVDEAMMDDDQPAESDENCDSDIDDDGSVDHGDVSRSSVDYPAVWSKRQWLDRKKKHKWLIAKHGSLGCGVCSSVKGRRSHHGLSLSGEWIKCKVSCNGTDKQQQLKSLRSKISLHQSSFAHRKAQIISTKAKKSVNIKKQLGLNETYHLVKNDHSFSNSETLTEMHINGVEQNVPSRLQPQEVSFGTDDEVTLKLDTVNAASPLKDDVSGGIDGWYPEVWSEQQWQERKTKHKWLSAHNGYLGCSDCASASSNGLRKFHKGLLLSPEWVNFTVTFNGSSKVQQLRSLRTKIFGHQTSLAHKRVQAIIAEAVKGSDVNGRSHEDFAKTESNEQLPNSETLIDTQIKDSCDGDLDETSVLEPQEDADENVCEAPDGEFSSGDTPLDTSTVPTAFQSLEVEDQKLMEGSDRWYPAVWSEHQWLERRTKHKWLSAKNGYLGCSDCASVSSIGRQNTQGLILSPEWVNYTVSFNGSTKVQQLRSLRTKISGHQSSLAHKRVQSMLAEVDKLSEDVNCKGDEKCIVKTEQFLNDVSDEPFSTSEAALTETQTSEFDTVVPPEMEPYDDADEDIGDETCDGVAVESISTVSQSQEADDLNVSDGTDSWYPPVWSELQWLERRAKHKWLSAKNGRLGCNYCAMASSLGRKKTQGLLLSPEWVNFTVSFNGSTKVQQLRSLRTKISGHQSSLAHQRVQAMLTETEKGAEDLELKYQPAYLEKMEKLFNTAYYIAKNDRPFSDHEDLIKLQIKNGIDVAIPLHECYSAIEIVNHIASEFRKRLASKLMTEDKKISVVLDESTTLGEMTVLIVYLKTFLGDTEDLIFLDLVSLDDHKADTVTIALLKCLKSHGMTATYLQKNLVCLVCDSTSLILGRTSSVGNLLKVKLKQPQMMVWYCSNAQMDLAVHVIISEINNIDISKHKSKLLLKNASSLMFIKLNGPPLATWNATPYVMSWLMDRQASEDVNTLSLNGSGCSNVDKQNLWKLF